MAQNNPKMSEEEREEETELLGVAFLTDCAGHRGFSQLARYETTIENAITRGLRQLELYRHARAEAGLTPETAQTAEGTQTFEGIPTPANEGNPPSNGGSDPRK